ncbi:MAG: hypothetical protein KTR16_00880 [Acidiferrobacterales bacterium]|nr:hypothetical protein [Acidiferrobacterales bacterium]
MKNLLLITFLIANPAIAKGQSQAELFEQLKSFIGTYNVKSEGSDSLVFYKLIARGSVLMETWYANTDNEEITLFHMDNDKLVATHYCGIGTQVTMGLEASNNKGALNFDFRFKSATNLASINARHNSGFTYTFSDSQEVVREEIWKNGDETSSSFLTLIKK